MKEAIQKAIEGGYTYAGMKLWHYSDTDEFRVHPNGGITVPVNEKQILLDPLFWQALGKAEGWEQEELTGRYQYAWIVEWHRFIDHLAEGKDAEEFFNQLLK